MDLNQSLSDPDVPILMFSLVWFSRPLILLAHIKDSEGYNYQTQSQNAAFFCSLLHSSVHFRVFDVLIPLWSCLPMRSWQMQVMTGQIKKGRTTLKLSKIAILSCFLLITEVWGLTSCYELLSSICISSSSRRPRQMRQTHQAPSSWHVSVCSDTWPDQRADLATVSTKMPCIHS